MGREFIGGFPEVPRSRPRREATRALQIAVNGETADSAKPMKGLGAGIFEIALRYRTHAHRVV